MKSNAKLRSECWLLLGISTLPGELILSGGKLTYLASGTGSAWPWQLRKLERQLNAPGLAARLNDAGPFQVFSEPVQALNFWCPWYYFDGGLKVQIKETVLRLSFARPGNSRTSGIGSLSEMETTRSRGTLWNKTLSEASREAADADP
jgi:hypothetical protein